MYNPSSPVLKFWFVMRISPQETLNATIGEFQEILDLIAEYDWDFDNYLTEDVPAAVKRLLLFSGKFLFFCVNSGLFLELILLAVPAFICISRSFILVDSTSEPPFSLKHLHKHLCCSTWFSSFHLSLGAKYACRWIMCWAIVQAEMAKFWVLATRWAASSCMLCWPPVVGASTYLEAPSLMIYQDQLCLLQLSCFFSGVFFPS